jgi:hypothetical protein
MDLPSQGLFQQRHAHPHSGEYLEVLGKHAAADWANGQHKTLTEAVTETVKQAQLSPEQVKRVVEFANTAAYLSEFKKEGTTSSVVDFPGGPADTSDILKDLNDGGGGSVFDKGTLDYSVPPGETKTASAYEDAKLAAMFGAEGTAPELPYENPYEEVITLRDKLAGAEQHLQSQISGLEIMYAELADRVYHEVKQASLNGTSLGEVMGAWETVAPSHDYIKVAFTLITPRLLREGVFHRLEDMTASVDKTAGARVVNPQHPLVVEFDEFCAALSKLAETREARSELLEHQRNLTAYLKQASAASTVGKAWEGANRLTGGAADAAGPFLRKHLGVAGGVVEGAIRHAPTAAVVGGALEAKAHVENSPSLPARAVRGAVKGVAQNIPGTPWAQQHAWEIQNGY